MPPVPAVPAALSPLLAQRLSVSYNNLGGLLKIQGHAAPAIACYEQVSAADRRDYSCCVGVFVLQKPLSTCNLRHVPGKDSALFG